MKKQSKIIFLIAALMASLLATSCISDKKIVYIQGTDSVYAVPKSIAQSFDLRIQPDDQLAISVTSKNRELIEPYNNTTLIGSGIANPTGANTANTTSGVSYFRVNKEGDILFPVFGRLHVAGMGTSELSATIQKLFREGDAQHAPSIKDALVTTRVMSFKVTILGDVKSPGTQTCSSERLTILEAIGRAGDLNSSARRDNVLVVREEDGRRVAYPVNLLDQASVFNSPAYYLQQNDVVIIQPNKSVRVKGSTSYTLLSVSSTLVSMVVSIISLIVAMNR